ncbi:MAG: GNAT family N-acetyltransferase [Pseudomonadota bacterium]
MNDAGPVQIMPARAGQEDAIRTLVRRAYAMYVPRMGREPGPMVDDYATRVAEGSAYVLEREGAICGALVLLDFPGYLLLDNVAIDPACQGQGLGRILIDFAEGEALRRGYPEIRLYTHECMVENIAMYPRLGYEESHRVTEKGYARVYMRKALASPRP